MRTHRRAPGRFPSRVKIRMTTGAATLLCATSLFAQTIVVTVNRQTPSGTSHFSPGISQIDNGLDYPWTGNNGAAVTNAQSLIAQGIPWMNSFIMAWGLADPWADPSQPGPSNWYRMDIHIQRAVDLGTTPVISLCEAPWWMKGKRQSDGSTALIPDAQGEWRTHTYSNSITDYRGITYPAGYTSPDPYGCRVLDNQMTNWLTLVEAIARRYMVPPYNVRYFQVWNEFKGYYNPTLNRWDYENDPGDPSGWNAKHGYCYMYNVVYNRLKSVATSLGIDPNTINVGGPYVVMDSGASASTMSDPSSVTGPWGVLDQRSLDVVSYWLIHKVGAEFVTIDGGNKNKFGGNITDPFTRCEKFATVNNWIRQQPGGATLPIWWAEWYTSGDGTTTEDYQAALGACSTAQQISSGASVTFLWGGAVGSAAAPPLWTPTTVSGGGQPTRWYEVYRDLGKYFGQGTLLYPASTSSTNIAVLASARRTMLVNKLSVPVTVSLDNSNYNLAAYQVLMVPLPGAYHLSGSPQSTNNSFRVTVTGPAASSAILETSTNLPFWSPEATNEPFAGYTTFNDSNATSFTRRFYRAKIQPY